MSDEEKNAQQLAEGDALKNTGDETVSTEAEAPPVTQESAAQSEPAGPSEDKILNLSEKELADRCTKYKEIGKRQARRELENEKQTQSQQSQPATYGQPAQALQSPGPNYVFDPVFNDWVDKDMTDEQKYQLLSWAVQNPQQQQAAVQQSQSGVPAQQGQVTQNASTAGDDPLKARAISQIEECHVDHDDFAMLAQTYISDKMALAAASMPGNGMDQLYEISKENPQVLFKIKNLPSSDEQMFRVRDLLRERSDAPKKVVTDVEPPPDSLESNMVAKDESELNYLERKQRATAKHWGR